MDNLQAALHDAPANDAQTAVYSVLHSCATDARSCPSVDDAGTHYQLTALTALTAARVEPAAIKNKNRKKQQVNITSIAIIRLSMTREYCDKKTV